MKTNIEKNDLTICSVYHSLETKRLLELNYEVTRTFNPNAEIRWLVSDGREPGVEGVLNPKNFTVVPGFSTANIPTPITSRTDYMKHINSYLHGESLNDMLRQVKTRFVVLLDNDFFIVRKNWISEIVSHMLRNDLTFFGSPFHPRRFDKYRYFPCQQCVFIDLQKVNRLELDYKPRHGESLSGLENFKEKVIRKIVHLTLDPRRYKVGHSRDTSYEVFDKFEKSREFRYESVKPVFNPEDDFEEESRFTLPKTAMSKKNLLLEKFLPERLSFIPKRQASFSKQGFKELGFFDARSLGDVNGLAWEEYLWRDLPFGFHLQSTSKRFRRGQLTIEDALLSLKKVLESFISKN